MAWVRIDDQMPEHPKLAKVGPLGLALQVAALCYCNRHLTDGFVPWAVANSLLSWDFLEAPDDTGDQKLVKIGVTCGHSGDDVTPQYVIKLLLQAGVWEVAQDGYQIHDYDTYQPTKEDVLRSQAQKQAAGQAGGLAKAQQNASRTPSSRYSRKLAEAKQKPSRRSSKTLAETYPNPNPNPNPVDLLPRSEVITSVPTERPALRALVDAFVSAGAKTRVARLVDLADAAGLPRNGGVAAAIVRDHGHDAKVARAIVSAATEARGDPWEYVLGTLKRVSNGHQSGGNNRPFDAEYTLEHF